MSSRTTITDDFYVVPKVKLLPLIHEEKAEKVSAARRSSVYARIKSK
jgi:hypothetical protein